MKFIEEKFPSKNIHSFELKKDDFNAHKNTLHLDCCFQPLGRNHLLIHENSFKNISDLCLLFELSVIKSSFIYEKSSFIILLISKFSLKIQFPWKNYF